MEMTGKIIKYGAAGALCLTLANSVMPVMERKRDIKSYLAGRQLKNIQVTGRGGISDCANSLFNYPIKTRFSAVAEDGKAVNGVVCRAWFVSPRIDFYAG